MYFNNFQLALIRNNLKMLRSEVISWPLQLGYGKYRQSVAAGGKVCCRKTFNSFEYLESLKIRGKYEIKKRKEKVMCLEQMNFLVFSQFSFCSQLNASDLKYVSLISGNLQNVRKTSLAK